MAEEENPWLAQRYQKDLPEDRTNFAKAWKLLEVYSHIPPDEIDAHVIAVVSCHTAIPLLTSLMMIPSHSEKKPTVSFTTAALAAGAS